MPQNYFSDGSKIEWLLAMMKDDEEEPRILETVDESGHDLTLMDYDVKSGDHLGLFQPCLYGCDIVWPINLQNSSVSLDKDH